jgi:hypothetical protein
MPFEFDLPTTGAASLSAFLSSNSHPSLLLSATTARQFLRSALKQHAKGKAATTIQDLQQVQIAAKDYLQYAFTIDFALSGKAVAGEEVDITLIKECEVEWSSTISSASGWPHKRLKLKSLECELYMSLHALALSKILSARQALYTNVYGQNSVSSEQRTLGLSTAAKNYLEAASIHKYISKRSESLISVTSIPEAVPQIQAALASLQIGEATVAFALKDDPYPAIASAERDENDMEWMVQPISIPKVRAQNCARICLAAAEHCAKAHTLLSQYKGLSSVEKSLIKYTENLRRMARGRACRFFGIASEMTGKTGEALAWLKCADHELGFSEAGDENTDKLKKNVTKGFSKLKKDWREKREEKKVEKGSDWGSDAGRFEEGRIVTMLEKKWTKQNNVVSLMIFEKLIETDRFKVNLQAIPPSGPLLAAMPGGRDVCTELAFTPSLLSVDSLTQLEALPEDGLNDLESSGSDDEGEESSKDLVGAFPGTRDHY